MAARRCIIEYEREMAIVGELATEDEMRLIRVGRLVSDANHERAEYAVLVAGPWFSFSASAAVGVCSWTAVQAPEPTSSAGTTPAGFT